MRVGTAVGGWPNPVSGEEYVNLVAFAPAGTSSVESWTATATLQELLDEFAGWDPRLVELIRSADTPGRWALLDRKPLDHWNRGNTTLLGDAAHPMFPFLAQGAAQAIEAGAALALCLAADPDDPITALGRYEHTGAASRRRCSATTASACSAWRPRGARPTPLR